MDSVAFPRDAQRDEVNRLEGVSRQQRNQDQEPVVLPSGRALESAHLSAVRIYREAIKINI
jgi:hypothetical protein